MSSDNEALEGQDCAMCPKMSALPFYAAVTNDWFQSTKFNIMYCCRVVAMGGL